MTYDSDFNEEHRFGSAAWAEREEMRAAGLFKRRGMPLGYAGQTPIHLESDAPILTVAGAGSGKLRDILGHVVINTRGHPTMWLDPRGELGAISHHTYAPAGEHAYYWNPFVIAGLPSHRCNPLDILTPDSPSLHADVQFIVRGLIPLSGSTNGQYFEQRAQEWLSAIKISLVETEGRVSFPALWRAINTIEGDPPAWADTLERMLASRFADVRRVAAEMLTKQADTPKEFGSVMGEIYAHLNILSDPALLASLDGQDVSLSRLVDHQPVSSLFLNVPGEYLKLWAPVLRVFFTVLMLYKSRAPQARRITMVVDEAGQLGRFEALLHAFSFGRGFGVRTWALFQDVGQIARNFDRSAVQSLMGNAQVRQFFGVRDYETAKMVSDMLGTQTLLYDGFEYQQAAKREKWNTAKAALLGDDIMATGYDYAHFDRTSQHRTKQARPLMTPDEVLRMGEDEQILFISGLGLNPIRANKYPYYDRRENAGRYLPNPYHPPVDKVRIKTRLGRKWVRVLEGPVPPCWASFPQHSHGRALFVEGYPL